MVNRPGQVKRSWLPTSGVGRLSVGLAVTSLLTPSLGGAIFFSDGTLLDIGLLLVTLLAAALAGLAGLIAALLAVLRIRDRGRLVLLPILWGSLVGYVLLYAVTYALAHPH